VAHRVPRCNALSCPAFHDVTPGTQMITHVTVARTGREIIVSFLRRIRAPTRSKKRRPIQAVQQKRETRAPPPGARAASNEAPS
jgi:hypothetical protein